ncbi:CotH kinase family protein [Candidatus Saccharibacteria bacterium]|nr:CotH kinase family protein [Candidatus Saccharibacteria bacterium]
MNDRGRWMAYSVGLFLMIVLLGGILIKNIIDRALYNYFPDRGVARINIDLNGVTLSEIKEGPKDIKYKGNDLQIYDNEEILRYRGIEIKGRGNLSWDQPKKSYQITFSKSTQLFDLGKTKKWILLANYLDGSYIRNDAAFVFADMLGMKYNNLGKFVEVYFNNEYEGLYYLIEKIEISKASVDIREDDGLLFELDNLHNDGNCYWTYAGNCLILKDYNDSGDVIKNVGAFIDVFNRFEIAAEKGDYETIKNLIDVKSFAEFFLVSEFAVDPDAYSSSFYLYQDGKNNKIYAGPVWDFDLAFGNKDWRWGQIWDDFYSPSEDMVRKKEAFGEGGLMEDLSIARIFYYLMEISDFKDEVLKIFNQKISGRKIEYLTILYERLNDIQKSAEVDVRKWDKKQFQSEKEEMKDWVKRRFEHFELQYGWHGANYINSL